MKRIVAIFVTVLLMFAALPVSFAEETQELSSLEQEVIQEARETYIKAQRFAGRRSFHGVCGLMVNTQLRCLGINAKRISFHGNDSYDHYSQLEVTTGGYYVMAYSGVEYDLLGALQEVSDYGKKDVRNILVGFQWTKTRAGSKYGHVLLINGIIDGTVYYVESYGCAGGPEGSVLKSSIEDFAASYNKWTRFEGLVHFGTGNYYDVCLSKNTDLTVQARFTTQLRSQPTLVGQKDCEIVREISSGEKFRATAIFNDGRSLYYRVETDEGFGFVSCNALSLLKVNEEGITLSETKFSGAVRTGEKAEFSGTVTDAFGVINALEVCITDQDGQLVRQETVEVEKGNGQLDLLRENLLFYLLEDGAYQVDIYVIRACPAVTGGADQDHYTRFLLKSYPLQVGT